MKKEEITRGIKGLQEAGKKKSASKLRRSWPGTLCFAFLTLAFAAMFLGFPLNGVGGIIGLAIVALCLWVIEIIYHRAYIGILSIFLSLRLVEPHIFDGIAKEGFAKFDRIMKITAFSIAVLIVSVFGLIDYNFVSEFIPDNYNAVKKGFVCWDIYKLAEEEDRYILDYNDNKTTFNYANKTVLVNFEPGAYYKSDILRDYSWAIIVFDDSCEGRVRRHKTTIEFDEKTSLYGSVCSLQNSEQWIRVVSFGMTEESSIDTCNLQLSRY